MSKIILKLNRAEFYKISSIIDNIVSSPVMPEPIVYDIEEKLKQIEKQYEL